MILNLDKSCQMVMTENPTHQDFSGRSRLQTKDNTDVQDYRTYKLKVRSFITKLSKTSAAEGVLGC